MGRSMLALAVSPFVSQQLRMVVAKATSDDLEFLTQLIEAGKVTPVIDTAYPLSDAPLAIRHLAAGTARGKLVITV
jgi:NADPH:quinone reductase-like Zn-dependent oxidoreductase